MKRSIKKESLFRISLVALLIVLIAIPVSLYFFQPRGDLRSMIRRVIEDDDDGNILGIGIYQLSGEAIHRAGSSPEKLSREEISSEFVIDNQDRTLKIIRDIGALDTTLEGGHIYLEFDIREPLAKFRTFQVVAILVFVLVLTLFIILYKKNTNFRKKIESQEQLVRLGEIARTLSHEIKNPLGAIRMQTGYLRRLLPENDDNKSKINKLSIIEEEVQRLVLLTNKIGDFLRDPVGTPVIIELGSFLNEMTKRFNWDIRFKDQRESSVHVQVDMERLRSVIENLLRNAIESMENSHEKRPVEVALSSDGKKVILSIFDRGSGIPTEQNKRVFDPFFTSKTKGSGIGLVVSRRFIEAAGGSLSLHPRKDGGTEARIVLHEVKEK